MSSRNLLNNNSETLIRFGPKYLWLLMSAFSLVLVGANWFEPRLISIFGLNTGAGALLFPFTYILADSITEVYGYKKARLAIWCGFLWSIIFLIYANLVSYFPSDNQANKLIFNSFTRANQQIIIASFISYLLSEPINSFLMSKLKIRLNGKYLGIRFVISILVSNIINLIIFCPLAFYGYMHIKDLIMFIATSWVLMVGLELLVVPLSVRLSIILKEREQLDIYDRNTSFNIFKLDTDYAEKDNEFSGMNK